MGVDIYKSWYWKCVDDNIDDENKFLESDSNWFGVGEKAINDMEDCMDAGGDWIQEDSNFDNFG